MAHPDLAGRTILVTRPAHEAAALAEQLRAVGANPIVFPTLEIRPLPLSAASRAALRCIGASRFAVFISVNAVRHGLPLIRAAGGWPATLCAAAVGHATAAALRAEGIDRVIAPGDGSDSEALLACSELATVRDERVLIFRGAGGRELLADTLRARGAQVLYVECYERAIPQVDPAPLCRLLEAGRVDAVVAASTEGLRNLLHILPPPSRAAVCSTPLVVTHPRVAAAARELGFARVGLGGSMDDEMMEALAAAVCPPSSGGSSA